MKAAGLALAGALVVGGGAVYFGTQPPPAYQPEVRATAMPRMPDPAPPLRPAEAAFDLVRVETDGAAMVAGRASPGQRLRLYLDGESLAEVEADGGGEFVSILALPPSPAPRLLELGWTDAGGAEHRAAEAVILAPGADAAFAAPALGGMYPPPAAPEVVPLPEPAPASSGAVPAHPVLSSLPAPEVPPAAAPARPAPPARAPEVFLAGPAGVTPMAPRPLPGPAALAIDSISYAASGAVLVEGRSGSAGTVRLALDGQPAGAPATLDRPGMWRVTLDGVAPGRYRLGARLEDADGTPRARTETPFLRADTATLPTAAGVQAVTVQPGLTLWRIARDHYGAGPSYVQVFEANRDRIADPDLIYPGQVLALPDR